MNDSRRVASLLGSASLALLLLASSRLRATGQAMPEATHARAEISGTLTLTLDGVSVQLSPADLGSMPQTTLTVRNAHSQAQESYTGVAMSDLLTKAGFPSSRQNQQRLLHSYLRAQGSDFYFVLYSGTEIESNLHSGNVIVALQLNGGSLGADGHFKLVSSEDTRPARWVRNLVSLTLVTVN